MENGDYLLGVDEPEEFYKSEVEEDDILLKDDKVIVLLLVSVV